MRDRIFLNKWFLAGCIFLALLLFPLLFAKLAVPVQFNQDLLQRLETKYGEFSIGDLSRNFAFSYGQGINAISSEHPKLPEDISEELKVFDYIYSWMPEKIIVYPTEGFYYYTFQTPEGDWMAGNIRFADIDKGTVSIAYFYVDDEKKKENSYFGRTVGKENGLDVEGIDSSLYSIRYKGIDKTVRLPFDYSLKQPTDLEMLPEEEFVGRIYDESGIKLFLIYNHLTNSFYMVLNEEELVTETFREVAPGFVFGERTGFVFYSDYDFARKILVGVSYTNVAENNYLDGPGDQVPIKVPMKDKLNKAYPNTLLRAGIDDYGVYLNRTEWVRIAVSPYSRYLNLDDVTRREESCNEYLKDRALFWTCLNREWWNTKEWRESIFEDLQAEGKNLTDIDFVEFDF